MTSHSGHHPHLLNEDFSFRSNLSLYIRSHFFSAGTVDWIRQELDAQLRRFTDAGIQPQHITTHHHFHAIPLLRRIVHELAQEYAVNWVRCHDFRANVSSHNVFLRRQRKLPESSFTMPDYASAIQA